MLTKSLMIDLRGPFGKRVIGIAAGRAKIGGVDEILRVVGDIDRKRDTQSQIFDSSRIAGPEHLIHATRLALTAQATGKNFADSLGIELVCWTAGARQINRAFERVGLRGGTEEVAILTVGRTPSQVKLAQTDLLRELGVDREDRLIELSPKKLDTLLRIFSISKKELKFADIKKLVLERVALLSLEG